MKTSSDSRGTVCFGVVDGHAGHKCAQAVSERLRSYLAVASCEDATLLPKLTPDSRLGEKRSLLRTSFDDEQSLIETIIRWSSKVAHTVECNKTGTSQVGAISKAQKAQFLNYAWDVFVKNSCFRTSASSSSIKRNIFRI